MSKFRIKGGTVLSGSVTPSGNKNEALPCVLACLLTAEPVILENVPKILDVFSLVEILKEVGVTASWTGDHELTLCAEKLNSHAPAAEACAKVRASILLLGPLLARCGQVELGLPGGDVIGARRLDTHFEGLETLGCKLEFGNPIKGRVENPAGTDVYLDEPSVTATENLLMFAVTCPGKTVLHNAACEPHVVGLCNQLNKMGAKISGIGTNQLIIEGVKKLGGARHRISSDFMEVGSLLCLGAIGKGIVTVNDVHQDQMRFILKTYRKLGLNPVAQGNSLTVDGRVAPKMAFDLSRRVATIYSGPWPAFPSDLMSVAIVMATQAQGTMIFHEKMFEGRMFFTDKLMSMGANIVLCDPHRIVVNGPSPLLAAKMSSPDVRAGMALLMAALVAEGESTIDHIHQIDRGYESIETKLQQLGAQIERLGV